jgi:hypothetical protein
MTGCGVPLIREERLDVGDVEYAILIGHDLRAIIVMPDAD